MDGSNLIRCVRRSRPAVAVALAGVWLLAITAPAQAGSPNVLRVGTYHGIPGQFQKIQAAVDAAKPGDWILVAPGDYHERADYKKARHVPPDGAGFALDIRTDRLHVRGMDRNGTIVDGTKPGSPPCSARGKNQSFGPKNAGGDPVGRSGIVVFKADGVAIQNLTVCNFFSNEIWWNGGDGSGKTGMGAFRGDYLTASTTYFNADKPQAGYGIFDSNARGPGVWDHTYASNMNDSGFYIGACTDCNAVINHSRSENSALGYSGTNSGGHLVIKNSVWDKNASGIVTNSQNNDDAPSPQDGKCPDPNEKGPTGSNSCWIVRHNRIRNNNNPNVPQSGTAAAGPTGTGLVIAGGRNDIVANNRVSHNGAWGILLVPYPDIGNPPPIADCNGGVATALPDGETACYFDDWGNEIRGNRMHANGFFGNPSNGDLAELSNPNNPGNCWHDNYRPAGEGDVSSEPAAIQTTHGTCGIPNSGDPLVSTLGAQAACDTAILIECPSGPEANYPQPTGVKLLPIPHKRTMPDPCHGVPANPWCVMSLPSGMPTGVQRAAR